MTLSDKIIKDVHGNKRIPVCYVKDFIRKLKTYEYSNTMGGHKTDQILISFNDLDKVLGEKLI